MQSDFEYEMVKCMAKQIYSLIHYTYLLSTCCMPGPALGS